MTEEQPKKYAPAVAMGRKGGRANRGKPKPSDHMRALALARWAKWREDAKKSKP